MWKKSKGKVSRYQETVEVDGYTDSNIPGLFIYFNSDSKGKWTIIHTRSGKLILDRIKSLEKAKLLALKLSQRYWDMPEGDVKTQEYADFRNSVYQEFKKLSFFFKE